MNSEIVGKATTGTVYNTLQFNDQNGDDEGRRDGGWILPHSWNFLACLYSPEKRYCSALENGGLTLCVWGRRAVAWGVPGRTAIKRLYVPKQQDRL